jgi:glycosyltransferase involved in cell wall biosynthesis
MKVSVIIPTYNRAALLDGTLRSLAGQDYPRDRYEIIVADNNSSDGTRKVVEDWREKAPVRVKYLFEGRQGVHYARNNAARLAAGEILYYTDDDMIADPMLLGSLTGVFERGLGVSCATGRVLPRWEVEPPDWITRHFSDGTLSINDRPEELIITPRDPGVFSCHQAITKEVFFRSGGFHPENTAGRWTGNGETGLNMEIERMGLKFAFVGSAVTYHVIPKERMTQRYINRRFANQGSCNSYTEYRQSREAPGKLYGKAAAHGLRLLRHLVRRAAKGALGRSSWRVERAWVSHYLQRMRYDTRLARDEGWRAMVTKENWLSRE